MIMESVLNSPQKRPSQIYLKNFSYFKLNTINFRVLNMAICLAHLLKFLKESDKSLKFQTVSSLSKLGGEKS
jgi:glutaredoxin-related protein